MKLLASDVYVSCHMILILYARRVNFVEAATLRSSNTALLVWFFVCDVFAVNTFSIIPFLHIHVKHHIGILYMKWNFQWNYIDVGIISIFGNATRTYLHAIISWHGHKQGLIDDDSNI